MKVLTIRKGWHKSCFKLKFAWGNKFSFKCSFDKNCLYEIKDSDKYDINKLIGLSNSMLGHHTSSIRIGWRCLDGENIQLVSYIYDEEIRWHEKILTTVKPEQVFSAVIKFDRQNTLISIKRNGDKIEKDYFFDIKENCKLRYFLWPYFGGNKKAPHKMTINIAY